MFQSKFSLSFLALTLFACAATAAVPESEAQRLKSELTPFGAERQGNAEGTIPGWEGGYTRTDTGYQPGQARKDPFAGERPLFSIDGSNYQQYEQHLSAGQKHMLESFPDFRMDVYPTQRTAAAPQWVYENTYRNALNARMEHGAVVGAYGGIPFPIPQDGTEAIWNHLLAFRGTQLAEYWRAYLVASDGVPTLAAGSLHRHSYPYYTEGGNVEAFDGKYYEMVVENKEPPFKAGEKVLAQEFVDGKRNVWQYLPGQRRTRRAPNVAYDTPDFISSGVTNFDEVNLFTGALDRYQWTLVGKQELYVPYNNNGLQLRKVDELLGKKFVNPDATRWELHRVWVVEASLAPGKRHAMPKRRFYLDEDTWMALVSDGWDANGKLWKAGFQFPFVAPEVPVVQTRPLVMYDFSASAYLSHFIGNERSPQVDNTARFEGSEFSPGSLGRGGR
ncbi:MAG: DUF1329 domain-containing protein [Pseudomonas sp.]|nr:DUF1329 domain-containing protein [Pseudomonas sp.]